MLTSGEKLSLYKILSAIGAGGMDEVYVADGSRLNRAEIDIVRFCYQISC